MNIKDNEIKSLLESYPKIAIYGLSPDSTKPSHSVPQYMQDKGWDIVGTYPKPQPESEFTIYKSLKEVPKDYRKFVDVFRSSENIPQVVDEVLELGGVEVLWLQLGISHAEAEKKAEAAGIKVISNRCLEIEHKKWF